MDDILNRFGALKAGLSEILQARRYALSKHDATLRKLEDEFKKFGEVQEREFAAALDAKQREAEAQQEAMETKRKNRAARVRRASTNIRTKLERQLAERKNAWNERKREARERAVRDHEARRAAFEAEAAGFKARLDEASITTGGLRDEVFALARIHGVTLETKRPAPNPDNMIPDDAHALGALEKRVVDVGNLVQEGKTSLKRIFPASAAYAIALLAAVGIWGGVFRFDLQNPFPLVCIGVGFVVLCISIFMAYAKSKENVYAEATELLDVVNGAIDAVELQKVREDDRYMGGIANLGCEGVSSTNDAEEKSEKAMLEDAKPLREAMAEAQERRDEILARIQERHGAARQQHLTQSAAALAALRADRDATIAQWREKFVADKRNSETERNTTIADLALAWQSRLADHAAFIDGLNRTFAETHPEWGAMAADGYRLPAEFNKEVPIGRIRMDLKALVPDCDSDGEFSIPTPIENVPVVLSFPLKGSVFIRANPTRRDEGMKVVSSVVLNLLRSFPAAKTKLTIIDPVGLGQNFAGLMHLADYDESLVNGRIWSDTAHIERKLTELTEHMEKVIQKFLRNRYASIDDYNIEAGQMAEPYRFVVIGDFPMGFSELATERLASIFKSGVRCGVYTIILYNDKIKLPQHVDMPQLKKNGIVLGDRGNGFVVEEENLNYAKFECAQLPSSTEVDDIVNAIGKQCRESARVQVPFEVVLPKADNYWNSVTDLSVRVPLGKSGADRLQHLELGKGTAQHALIAGKTGSGKSNLFHVIITNAAAWYSPRELEFYLIDFKKGVEFKTYGVHRLRHARVVAIESDREFALSVLQRIDKELTNRGELFRKARVQDFPSFRKACPEVTMPRTLLMIDEFQEFFTDDDNVAQDAALLLDRIVRQGRAFGIHVILGSQTLGGTYTLSKSTLGQVVVRIALQCTEADSYLVLSDDNAAASLLTRPGDAIYNDMAGMIEGNNPFQAVWLPKSSQDAALSLLQVKAVEGGFESVEPLVVFEGNSLSDIRNNMILRSAALQGPQAVPSAPRIWLGEPNSIKGPTEVVFGKQAGSNLLVVGQRGDTEMAMCCSTVISLAATHAPNSVIIRILDGARPESPARERLNQLKAMLPHDIEICDYRRVPEVLQETAATMKARQEQSAPAEQRIFILVLGLEKLRMLRQEDEFSFSSSSDDGANPSKAFTDLLLEGPNTGVHTIIWCDTLSNLNRAMSRKTLKEFEMRVLFQMSASDSSELIDSPAANRLGMYNALFYSAQSGAMEKFRPYEAPDKEYIEDFGRLLPAGSAAKVK